MKVLLNIKVKLGSGIAGIIFALVGCQPEPNTIDLVQHMLVQTSHESTANFSSYSSYSFALDTLGFLYFDSPLDSILTGTYASQVTAQIKFNMDKAGYNRVANNQNPDLAVSAFVVRDFGVIQSLAYPGYYGSYSAYYFPKCYGFSHYYGYPALNVFNNNTATLVFEIIDLKNKDSQGKVKLLWVAYVGDLVNTVDINSLTMAGVDDAFAQSAYIKK